MISLLPISPSDLGFPAKFSQWRIHQDRIIVNGLDSPARFVAQSVPTGGGKSPAYVAQALLSGNRCAILTSTKGLQDQLLTDFSSLGLVDIRGRANYPCRMSPGMNCEEGSHAKCPHNGTGNCSYHVAYQAACSAPLVVTNYAYWILVHKYGEGLGRFRMLVLDEAHNAPDEVASVMSQHFTSEEVLRILDTNFPRDDAPIEEWKQWAHTLLPAAEAIRDQFAEYIRYQGSLVSIKDARWMGKLKALCTKLLVVANAQGEWVAEASATRSGGYHLDPVWPSLYTEHLLFLANPKVLLTSATIIPKTLGLLGVPADELDFQDYPSTFPSARSPLYRIPTCQVNHRTMLKQSHVDLWLKRIDQIIEGRLDRRGIIHTVSYARKDLILSNSQFSEFMIGHVQADAIERASYFKRTSPPAILLSPSMATGYDFPYSACEYQILVKVPYPDTRSRIMQARCKSDPLYGPYITAQQLVQSCGRAMRAADDRCENFIIDDHIAGFIAAHRDLLPSWFMKLYRKRDQIPPPPPKLENHP